jgi:hypothetical protein
VIAGLAAEGGRAKARARRRSLAAARRRRLQKVLIEERQFGRNVREDPRLFLFVVAD